MHYALLALLGRRAAHGYELQRAFLAGGDLAGVVHLEQPTLYAALKELAARGLIAGTETRDGLRPPRTVYALTPAGRQLTAAWLRAPVERLRQVRLDFLLKVYFARQRGARPVRTLVDAQIATCERYLAALSEEAGAAPPDSFGALVVASRVSAARATLDWLREYRARL